MRVLAPLAFALLGCTAPTAPPRHAPPTPNRPAPVASAAPAAAPTTPAARTQPPSYLASSRIAAHADGALVIDADSGMVVRTDRTGAVQASLAIGKSPGLLAL